MRPHEIEGGRRSSAARAASWNTSFVPRDHSDEQWLQRARFSLALLFVVGCAPRVSDISPPASYIGASVTISGTGFGAVQGPSTVAFAGVGAGAATAWSDTSIRIAVPDGASTGDLVVRLLSVASSGFPFVVSGAPRHDIRLPTNPLLAHELEAGSWPILGLHGGAANDAGGVSDSVVANRITDVSDLDEDGNLDLIVSDYGGLSGVPGFRVLFGNGQGGFDRLLRWQLPGQSQALSAGDIDEDGHVDVVAFATPNRVQALLGDGAGALAPSAAFDFPLEWLLVSLVLLDVDGDGHLDAIFAASAADSTRYLVVLRGDGHGEFPGAPEAYRFSIAAGGFFRSGDLDGDHHADLVGIGDRESVVILLSDGSGKFLPERSLAVAGGVGGVALGDFDRSGSIDLATTRYWVVDPPAGSTYEGAVDVFLNDGSGGFTQASTLALQGNLGRIEVGDFDGDSVLDLVAASSDTIHVLLGDGTGTFVVTSRRYPVEAAALMVADLDGDGRSDLWGYSGQQEFASVLVGDGASGFGSPERTYLTGGEDWGVDGGVLLTFGQFVEGGPVDAFAVATSSIGVEGRLARRTGAGTFTVTSLPWGAPARPSAIANGDANGDGHVDLLLVVEAASSASIWTFLGNGRGDFAAPIATALTSALGKPITGDFDGDGRLDLAGAIGSTGQVEVRFGAGDGGFGEFMRLSLGGVPVDRLVAADLNGDTRDDLIVGQQSACTLYPPGCFCSGATKIRLGRTERTFQSLPDIPPSPPGIVVGDMNRDGRIDVLATADCPAVPTVYFGLGDGTFQSSGARATTLSPAYHIRGEGDFDGDGIIDLCATQAFHFVVARGTHSGRFELPEDVYASTGDWTMPSFADVDGDSHLDVIHLDRDRPAELLVSFGDGNGGFVDRK